MQRSVEAKVGPLAIVALVVILAVPTQFMAYNVSTFSDGASEKTLVFTDIVKDGTLFLSIPRATNLSAASISVTGGASIIGDALLQTDFSSGTAANISLNNDLKLSMKADWWNGSWTYRVTLDVLSPKDHVNIIVEKDLNLTTITEKLGLSNKSISSASIRLVERLPGGSLAPYNMSLDSDAKYILPMEMQNLPGFNAARDARIMLRWLVPGATTAAQGRRFELYYNSADHPEMQAPRLPKDYPELTYSNSKGPSPQQSSLFSNMNGSFSDTPSLKFRIGTTMGVNHRDVNSDGFQDIIFPVFRNGTYFNATSRIFFGGQNGIDNTTYLGVETLGAYDVAVEDLNNDGFQDLVFACHQNFSNYEILSMAYYGGPAGFNATPDEFFNTTGAAAVATGDFNRDGWMDVVFACERNQTTGNIGSQVYLGGPSGFNENADILLQTEAAFGVDVADINLDGWLDIVFANNRNTSLIPPNDVLISSPVYYGGPSGFNATPDVLFDTSGAMDVTVADLNLDGWPDIVFANYADGMTTRTLSCAYFGSPTGFDPHTPGAWFQTAWAFGVDVGDINLDGNPDVAFANYFDGITYAINSTIFQGPCVGLKSTPSVKLPTIGATEVVIADVGRYYMSTDRNPPVITVGAPDGRFIPAGTYQSLITGADEKVLSASATWNAVVPSQPGGCNVSVYLSNNAGAGWTKVQDGIAFNFTTEGKALRYKVGLFSDAKNVETPVFQDITINYEKESYPYNVTLDINADDRDEWSYPGKFNTTAVLNETTMGLSTLLMQIVPREGTGNFTVPLKFSSERPGVLRVFGLRIAGNYRPTVLTAVQEVFMTEDSPLADYFNIHSFFQHLDEDRLVYTVHGNRNVFLNISPDGSASFSSRPLWNGEEVFYVRATDGTGEYAELRLEIEVRAVPHPPRFISALTNVTVPEGETARSVFNLLDFVEDLDTPKTSLIFSVADVSNRNVSVSMDANDNVDVFSRAGWDGVVEIRIKVSDGVLSDTATFNVTVEKHNRPPVLSPLPPVQLEASSRLDKAFNLHTFTTDTDTPKANITFRIDENTNPQSGVTVDADGSVNIRPDKGWSGTAYVVVNVSDGEYGVRASFTVTVTPKAVTPEAAAVDNTFSYLLILLFIVMIIVVAADIGMRMRRPKVTPFAPSEAPPAAAPPRPVPVVRKMKNQPVAPVARRTEEPRAEPPPEQLQMDAPQAGRPPLYASDGAATSAGAQGIGPVAEPAALAGAPTEARFDVVSVEEGPIGVDGGMAPVPSGLESPPESVPDVTQAVSGSAPETGERPAEPETMEADVTSGGEPAGTPDAPAVPQPEIGAGEVEQKQSGMSAAALLAALQKPGAPPGAPAPPSSEAGAAPPAPEIAGPSVAAGMAAAEQTKTEPTLVSKATEGEHAAAEVEQKDLKPITRVRCAGCKAAIPIFSAQRPLVVTCPQCGRMGMLK